MQDQTNTSHLSNDQETPCTLLDPSQSIHHTTTSTSPQSTPNEMEAVANRLEIYHDPLVAIFVMTMCAHTRPWNPVRGPWQTFPHLAFPINTAKNMTTVPSHASPWIA